MVHLPHLLLLPLLLLPLLSPAAAWTVHPPPNPALSRKLHRSHARSPLPRGCAPPSFEVCLNKYCRKRGARRTLQLFEEMAGEGVVVQAADMSHAEHGCFDECTMGPNVRVGGEGGRIVNGVKGAAAVAALLGVEAPEST
ncbi:hypothetical protein AB1Y20_023464 [Prymnesium parvum]|uniref:Uncharacterized protein n=1 Tax=Prymnesium parvum TaxID=97485 RepID=A0AB34JEC7_PRYPA